MKLLPHYLRGAEVGQAQKQKLLNCLEAITIDHPTAAESWVNALRELVNEAFTPDPFAQVPYTPPAPDADTPLSGYAQLISEAIGTTDRVTLAEVEDIMRNDIFHSTLDWVPRDRFIEAAREAYNLYRPTEY